MNQTHQLMKQSFHFITQAEVDLNATIFSQARNQQKANDYLAKNLPRQSLVVKAKNYLQSIV